MEGGKVGWEEQGTSLSSSAEMNRVMQQARPPPLRKSFNASLSKDEPFSAESKSTA